MSEFLAPEASGEWTRRECAGGSRCTSACTMDDSAGVDSVRENRRMSDAASLAAEARSEVKLMTITLEIARRRCSTAGTAASIAVAVAAGRVAMREAAMDALVAWPAADALRALPITSGSVPGA